MKQYRADRPEFDTSDSGGTGGFLTGDFHLSRKDRVMIRFFGRLREALSNDKPNLPKDSVEGANVNSHQERM